MNKETIILNSQTAFILKHVTNEEY